MFDLDDILIDELGLSKEELASLREKSRVIPYEYHGEVTGHIVLFGNEIHCVSSPGYRGRCTGRRQVIEIIQKLLDEFGFLTTRIPINAPEKDRTGERLGFTYTWSDDRFDYYICTDLPYGRK